MARVPDFKRLAKEDFPAKYRDLIDKLAFPINSHIEQVRSALSGNLDFENLAQEIRTLSFTTGSNGQPLNTLNFQSGLNNRVQGMLAVRVIITSDNTAVATQTPVFTWSQNGTLVTIGSIGGLEPETSYEIGILTL